MAEYIAQMRDPVEAARHAAARKLGKYADPAATDALCQALKDKSWHVRRAAAVALGRIGDARAVPALAEALTDRTRGVRRKSVAALARVGGEQVVEPLCRALLDKSPMVRQDAGDALVRLGGPAVVLLCRYGNDAMWPGCGYAVGVLRELVRQKLREAQFFILADARLKTGDKYACLRTLHAHTPTTIFSLGRTPQSEIRRFCEAAMQAEQEVTRESARAILEYMSLARPSERDPASEKEILLRAAQGAVSRDGADILLRASDAGGEASAPSLLERLKRLFQRDGTG
jgi:HEAT repeat protein